MNLRGLAVTFLVGLGSVLGGVGWLMAYDDVLTEEGKRSLMNCIGSVAAGGMGGAVLGLVWHRGESDDEAIKRLARLSQYQHRFTVDSLVELGVYSDD